MENILKIDARKMIFLFIATFIINIFTTEVIMAQDNYEKATFAGGCF